MKNTLIFLGGVAVGGLAATLYFKKQMAILEEDYQRIATDEINNAVNNIVYKEIEETPKVEQNITYEKEDKAVYNDILKDNNYTENAAYNDEEEEDFTELYIITADEFGDNDEYELRTLSYFTNGVILDEDNCLFDSEFFNDNILNTLHSESKNNKDMQSVYVRDDNEKIDYEIIMEVIDSDTFFDHLSPNSK